MVTDVLVLDETTRESIGFAQSFKRNSILLLSCIPLIGSLVLIVLLVIIAIQVRSGFRLGDRYANTRVIWKKYATSPVFVADARVPKPVVNN